jgi:hypothetical protein
MADPTDEHPISIPVLASPVAISLLVSMLSQILAALSVLGLKWHVTDEQLTTLVGGIAQAVALIAAVYSLYKRYTSKVQPLALTKNGAENKAAAITSTTQGNTP